MTDYHDMELEAAQMHVGKKLVSVERKNDNIRYNYEGGGSFQYLVHIPVPEHKLAILVKALDLATEEVNGWFEESRSKPGSFTINHFVKDAEARLKSKEYYQWSVLDKSVDWPEWLQKLEEK